jgi:hypothetical protein
MTRALTASHLKAFLRLCDARGSAAASWPLGARRRLVHRLRAVIIGPGAPAALVEQRDEGLQAAVESVPSASVRKCLRM